MKRKPPVALVPTAKPPRAPVPPPPPPASAAIAVVPTDERMVQTYVQTLNTAASRAAALRGLIQARLWFLARGISLVNVDRATLQEYREHLREQGLQATTINWRMTMLRGVFREACAHGWISPSVIPTLELHAIPTRRDHAISLLSLEQLRRMVQLCRTKGTRAKRDGAIMALALCAGLRRSEIAALTLGQLDTETRMLNVRGKGGVERIVPLSASALALLDPWLVLRLRCPPESATDSSTVLCAIRPGGALVWHESISSSQVQRVVTALAARAGVSCSPHMLRHAFASYSLAGSQDHLATQRLLGHASPQTTANYDHRGLSTATAVIATLDEVMRSVFEPEPPPPPVAAAASR